MNHTQFLCYGLLKLFLKEVIEVDKNVKGLLCSYFFKTSVFWEITESPIQWNMYTLLSHFWSCFQRLLHWVNVLYCPNFFIPGNNMFANKFDTEERAILLGCLGKLYHEGYRCLLRISFIDYGFSVKNETPGVLGRPFRRQMTDLVLNVSFWPELEHKMAFVYARKDDVAVASFWWQACNK